MGSTWSSGGFCVAAPSASASRLDPNEVLALCEDGDLLLVREQLADAALRVGVEFAVAQDIERMQRGHYPVQRVTALPAWTSCELFLRHEGALHVVAVGVSGLALVPFEKRVQEKLPKSSDRFAIRRLQHNVRSEALSAYLRDLAVEIAAVAPISWHALSSPEVEAPNLLVPVNGSREQSAAVMKVLPPLLQPLLRRMMKLFNQNLKLGATPFSAPPVQKKDPIGGSLHKPTIPLSVSLTEGKSAVTPWNVPPNPEGYSPAKAEDAVSGLDARAAMEMLGDAEVAARLAAAFAVAVYEHVQLLEHLAIDARSEPLVPTSFWSSGSDRQRVGFSPSNALGTEMLLVRAKPT